MKRARRIELNTLIKLKKELLTIRLEEQQFRQEQVLYKKLEKINK